MTHSALTAELAALNASKPHRRYRVTIEVGADTLQAMATELRRIAQSVERSSTRGVLGGCDVGSRFEVVEDASVTNESYMAAIHEYLDRRAQLEQELRELDKPQGNHPVCTCTTPAGSPHTWGCPALPRLGDLKCETGMLASAPVVPPPGIERYPVVTKRGGSEELMGPHPWKRSLNDIVADSLLKLPRDIVHTPAESHSE